MNNTIYFDMDGTIADLYGVENWQPMLESHNAHPYKIAEPLIDTYLAESLLLQLQENGIRIGVVSWLAKNSSKEYDKAVRSAKKEWLQNHFPNLTFDETHFVKYGTRKDYIVKDKLGIIFDDDERVRENWKGFPVNPNEKDICELLQELCGA